VTDRVWAPMSRRLLELAGVRPGHRVLDLACGIGDPSLTAAELVGLSGEVVGIDLSAEMIEVARARAVERGVHNVRFEVSDADKLSLSDGRFDAAVCRWALMFFADLPQALLSVLALLEPGGRFAAFTVGRPDRYPLIDAVLGGILDALELPHPPHPPPGAPGFFSLSDPAVLRRHFEAAGFKKIEVEHFGVDYRYTAGEEVAETEFAINMFAKGLVEQRPERREQAVRAVAARAKAYAEPDGAIRYPPESNDNLYVVGQR